MNIKVIIALSILIPLVICAFFGSNLAPYDPTIVDIGKRLLPPSSEHMLGTDHLGRDVFSRLLVGAKYSLSTVFYILAILVCVSLVLGSICGYLGGKFDTFIMRACDSMLVFPTIVLALFLIGILGPGLVNLIIATSVTHLAWYTRLVRSYVLSLKHQGYVVAAKSMGLSKTRIIIRHILPAVLVQMLILASLDVGHMLLHVAGLSFLGLGIQPPTPEWGVMIAEARNVMRTNPMLMLYPGIAIFLATAACNLLGDSLRDYLDPHLRQGEI